MANNTISQVEINGTTYDLLDANTLSAVSALDQRVTSLESSVDDFEWVNHNDILTFNSTFSYRSGWETGFLRIKKSVISYHFSFLVNTNLSVGNYRVGTFKSPYIPRMISTNVTSISGPTFNAEVNVVPNYLELVIKTGKATANSWAWAAGRFYYA